MDGEKTSFRYCLEIILLESQYTFLKDKLYNKKAKAKGFNGSWLEAGFMNLCRNRVMGQSEWSH